MANNNHGERKVDKGAFEAVEGRTEKVPRTGMFSRAARKLNSNWGWVIATATSITFAISFGYLFSFGLIMVELMSDFGSSTTATGYIGTLSYGVYCAGCILIVPVSGLLGYRLTNVLGVTVCTASCVISSFAPNILVMFFSHGFLFGIGICCVVCAGINDTLAFFPSTHQSLALALATCGVNIGCLMVNPLVYILITRYGWRIMMRIMSVVILMIGLPCSLTYRSAPEATAAVTTDELVSGDEPRLQSGKAVAGKNEMKEELGRSNNPHVNSYGPLNTESEDVDSLSETYLSNDHSASVCQELHETQLDSNYVSKETVKKRYWEQSIRLLKMPDIWLLQSGLFFGAIALCFLYFSTANVIVTAGFSKKMASLAMSAMGISEAVGKLALGLAMDRLPVPKIIVLMVANCIGAVLILILLFVTTEVYLFIQVTVQGLVVMAALDSLPHSLANQLYTRDLSVHIWAANMLSMGIGGTIAAVFGESVDKTGTYQAAFYGNIGIFIASTLLLGSVVIYQGMFAKERYFVFKNVGKRYRAIDFDDCKCDEIGIPGRSLE